jgi:hypothetical protein
VKSRATLGLFLIFLSGCHRQTGPDANYEQGSRIYQQLYAQELDDAYGDPRMDQVAALLAKVDPRSVDAEAAKRMLASIDTGRAALQKQRADREKMAAAAAASFKSATSSIDPQQILAAVTPDAGSADPFGSGAAIADVNATTGGCLIEGEPFREQGTGMSGTVYRLAKSQQCQDKLPGFAGQIVLVTDGHIYRRTADPTPAPAAVPDAGAAVAASPAAPRPEPSVAAKPKPPAPPPAVAGDDQADAGGEMRTYIPGAPMPGAAAQQQQDQQQ